MQRRRKKQTLRSESDGLGVHLFIPGSRDIAADKVKVHLLFLWQINFDFVLIFIINIIVFNTCK